MGPLVYMSIECFAKCCHLCVTLSLLSPARISCYRVFTWQKAWSCVRPEKEFSRVFDLGKSFVVRSTWRVWSCVRPKKEFWSCVRPEKEFGRVFHLIERVSSCVRPEYQFGLVFDRAIVWSYVRPAKEFGRMFDLRNSLVVRSTWEGVLSCIRPVFVV